MPALVQRSLIQNHLKTDKMFLRNFRGMQTLHNLKHGTKMHDYDLFSFLCQT